MSSGILRIYGWYRGGNVGFLFRLFVIFIIAYSIYSVIMFVLKLLMRHAQRNVPPKHEDERLRSGMHHTQTGRESNSVIELKRDQYKVE